jgi:hypothetical protein
MKLVGGSSEVDKAIRIYALAREFGLESQPVLHVARRLRYATNLLSILDAQQRAKVEAALDQKPPEDPDGMPCKLQPRGPGPGKAQAHN